MQIAESTFLRKRRAERTSSTIKYFIPEIISRLYAGNTFSIGVSPKVTGNKYNATSIKTRQVS